MELAFKASALDRLPYYYYHYYYYYYYYYFLQSSDYKLITFKNHHNEV